MRAAGFGALLLLWSIGPNKCGASELAEQRQRLIEVLRQSMQRETGWVRIHAADALIVHGYLDEVAHAFAEEADNRQSATRIGVWRVMAGSARDPQSRHQFIDRIREVLLDPQAPDRVDAAETLAKLNAPNPQDRAMLEQWLGAAPDRDDAMVLWLLVIGADLRQRIDDETRLASLVNSSDPTARLRAAMAISRLPTVAATTRESILKRIKIEPQASPARVFLLIAARLRDRERTGMWQSDVEHYLRSGNAGEQYQAAIALGMLGRADTLPALTSLLASPEGDARIGAADGSLRILRSTRPHIGALDWGVITLYLAVMLGVGVYYSRTGDSREQYLLGGRQMKPWFVGVSYFATIFSTVTYMSWPGEVARNGPMLLGQVIGFPIVIAVIGYFIIPRFMSLKVTSAYEILELRLGLSVRMLGSVFFLVMRLFWMGLIIYTTTREILVPVAGLDPSYATAISVIIGLITVVYTSIGGFKAVVFTDVMQTFVLFGGAVVTILGVTMYFGGFGWFPTQWDPAWQKPVLGFDPTARVTLASAVMTMLAWQVCTASSDQMAIQRYLATRDARAARSMYTTAMSANVLVLFLLTALGLSVLGYFKARPDMMNAGQTIESSADQLFSQYIVFGLPAGFTGLVIAGLLAAAMSSLSSGLSSCSAVVTVDFVERFGLVARAEREQARTARLITLTIGIVIVLLSTIVGAVKGNLLDMTFKVVNLLTVPLAGLFFMALFVRWATPFGTWVGAIVGTAASVLILYWQDFTGLPGIGMLWSMPLSLVLQLASGMLASLIPIGSASPMLGTVGADVSSVRPAS